MPPLKSMICQLVTSGSTRALTPITVLRQRRQPVALKYEIKENVHAE